MASELLYSDPKMSKQILEHILEHDCLPKGVLVTTGNIIPNGVPGYSMFVSGVDLERANNYIFSCAMRLMSKYKRKASDTAMTLDCLLTDANQVLMMHSERAPGYQSFSKTVTALARLANSLDKYAGRKPDITIKEIAEKDKNIGEMYQKAYDEFKPDAEKLARQMLESCPEYKGKVKEERVVELMMNAPLVLTTQLHTGITPSDFQAPEPA